MSDDDRTLYRRVGRRYEAVGWEFAGFPQDGVWLVQWQKPGGGRSSRHIMRIGDLPEPWALAQLETRREAAVSALQEALGVWKTTNMSVNEVVSRIFRAMAGEWETG